MVKPMRTRLKRVAGLPKSSSRSLLSFSMASTGRRQYDVAGDSDITRRAQLCLMWLGIIVFLIAFFAAFLYLLGRI